MSGSRGLFSINMTWLSRIIPLLFTVENKKENKKD